MFVDSNFFVSAIVNPNEIGERARRKIKTLTGMVTPLVIDEIAWSIRKTYPQNIRTTIKAIYTNPKIRVESIHASAGIEMLDIMEKHNLKPRDALHVAVMLANNETEILSNDPDFDCVPGITRIGF